MLGGGEFIKNIQISISLVTPHRHPQSPTWASFGADFSPPCDQWASKLAKHPLRKAFAIEENMSKAELPATARVPSTLLPSYAHRENIPYICSAIREVLRLNRLCTFHHHRPVSPLIKFRARFPLVGEARRHPRSLHPTRRATSGLTCPIRVGRVGRGVSLLNLESLGMRSLVLRGLCNRPLFGGPYASLSLPDMLVFPSSDVLALFS